MFRKTGETWKEDDEDSLGPRPFIVDLSRFTSLKKLEKIGFDQYWEDKMGFNVINPVKITKLKSIKNIHINESKFSSEDLIKIRKITVGPRDNFLKSCQKKDESIKSEFDLSAKDRKKYDILDREIRFGDFYRFYDSWGGTDIDSILEQRKKKKN